MTNQRQEEPAAPPSNLTSLRARLRNHARELHQLETRVQRRLAALVVNEIFLTVNDEEDWPAVLVKGGTAIDLRRGTAPARLSKDWDGAVRGDLDEFIGHARTALANGWSGFTGRLTRESEIDVPGLAVRPRRFDVKLDYRGKPFATVPVELSPAEGRTGEEHDLVVPVEYSAIGLEPRGPVYCLSLRYQIAQKIHACTDPLDGIRDNDRARDLVDLQLLVLLLDVDALPSIRTACLEVFGGRQRHTWPPAVRTWPAWPSLYGAAITNLGGDVLTDVDEAAEWLREFLRAIEASADDAG
jgi:hypothetical protein